MNPFIPGQNKLIGILRGTGLQGFFCSFFLVVTLYDNVKDCVEVHCLSNIMKCAYLKELMFSIELILNKLSFW